MTTVSGSEQQAAGRASFGRDPRDVSALLWFLLVTLLGLFAARAAQNTAAGLENDLVDLVGHLPDPVIALFEIAVLVLHLLFFFGVPLFLLINRQWRRWGIYTAGWVVASVAAEGIARAVGTPAGAGPASGLGLEALGNWPPAQSVATAACALVLLSPHLSGAWRRFGWGFVAALAVLRVVTAEQYVRDVVLMVGVGAVVGSALLLAFGRQVVRPTAAAVGAGLRRIGLAPVDVQALAVQRSSTTADPDADDFFAATLGDGRQLICKVVSSTHTEADSLLRRYRRVRLRGLGEEVSYSTVRRAAAVEAMLAMTARQAGARTPPVVGVSALPTGEAMVIAFEKVTGQRLADVAPERLTDNVLAQAWAAVAAIRGAGVAHRDLNLTSWMLDDEDRLWVIDFSFGEPAAGDGALSADIAELLAATYAVVGAQRAVAAALRALGPETLLTGLSHLVPVALTRLTRSAVKARPDGLAPLVKEAAAACGVEQPKPAELERVKPRSLLMAGLLAVAVYVLLPQLADLPRMITAIRTADPQFAAAAGLASVATYLGSGLAIAGSCPAPLSLLHSWLAAVAATFVGAIAPPGVAHVGLNARFLSRQGLSSAVAVSATAVKEVAMGSVHLVLLLLLALAAGSSGALSEELDKLPSLKTVGIGLAVLLALFAAAAATPAARRMLTGSVIPALRHSVESLRELASSPAKMMMLFSGSLILQLAYVSALYFAVQSLGGQIGWVTVGLIYLTVGSAAAVAPTPGGIGAVEAVLLAALTGVGMAASSALAAVFLYRLVTFWIPIPFGGLSFRFLLARDLL